MIDRTQRQPNTNPLPKSPTAPAASPAPASGPTMAPDAFSVSAPAESANVFYDSGGRVAYDVVAGAGAGAEVERDLRATAAVVQQVGGKLPLLGGMSARLGNMLDGVVDWGMAVGARAPGVGAAFVKLAKAAPVLGVGVAFLDIGRAVIEQNPEKKQVAQGQAALSALGGLAGVLGAGAAVGATAFGVALAPLAVPALVVGVTTTALALADTFLLEGAVSKAISRGLEGLGSAVTGLWRG